MEKNINAFEQLFDLNDPEIIEVLDQIDKLYNKLMTLALRKKYGVEAKVIDENHIEIDGVVMDDMTFGNWLFEKEMTNDNTLSDEDIEWGKA